VCRRTTSPLLLVLLTVALMLPVAAAPAAAAWPPPPTAPTPAIADRLDEETLQRLTIFAFPPGIEPATIPVGSLDGGLQTWPGGTLALTLGFFECCYFFHPVAARAVWSIAPADGAVIEPETGLLTIDLATPSGSVFTVRADVENGRRIVEAEVAVFTPDANPLVGWWREGAQMTCDTGADVVPAEPIEEVVFDAAGTFTVTWFPFEVYKDYWGTYAFDLERGTLDLTIEGGNYVPPDVDGSGRFAADGVGQLLLTELWLGTPPNGTGPANCGHRLFGG
jgi:hypothetical protein